MKKFDASNPIKFFIETEKSFSFNKFKIFYTCIVIVIEIANY